MISAYIPCTENYHFRQKYPPYFLLTRKRKVRERKCYRASWQSVGNVKKASPSYNGCCMIRGDGSFVNIERNCFTDWLVCVWLRAKREPTVCPFQVIFLPLIFQVQRLKGFQRLAWCSISRLKICTAAVQCHRWRYQGDWVKSAWNKNAAFWGKKLRLAMKNVK